MTQTMIERLIAAAAERLKAYDFGYEEAREGTGAEIVDAILAELRAPTPEMMEPFAYLETYQMPDTKGRFTAMIDAVREGK